MVPSYADYIFVHLRQKARLRPELSPKFLSTLGPNPTRKPLPDLQLWLELLTWKRNISEAITGRKLKLGNDLF